MAKYYGKKSVRPETPGKRFLPLLALVGALILIVVGVVALGRPGQATRANAPGSGAGPRVAVDRDKLDFGKVKMNTPVTAAFKVRNEGSEPLQILGQPQVRVVEGC